MDDFKELNDAKDLIAEFQSGIGPVAGNAKDVLAAVRAKIDAYIKRKLDQRQNV